MTHEYKDFKEVLKNARTKNTISWLKFEGTVNNVFKTKTKIIVSSDHLYRLENAYFIKAKNNIQIFFLQTG
jgi:hypothetical protein